MQNRIGGLGNGTGLYPFSPEGPFQRVYADLFEGVLQPGSVADGGDMNGHHSKQEDNEYARKGTCSVFMFVESLGGRRYVCASRQRPKKD